MEVHGTNFHFIATKWKFTARTFISSPRNGSSRHELSFHRHETEVHGTNFHFIATKRKFTARTSISSPRNGPDREGPLPKPNAFMERRYLRGEGRRLATKGTKSTKEEPRT